MALLEVKNLKKVYTTRLSGAQVEALRSVSFSVESGEFVAIMLLAVLSGCAKKTTTGDTTTTGGDTTTEEKPAELTDYRWCLTQANEMETFNVLYSQSNPDLRILTNCIDGLLTNDAKGNLIANVADKWETNDNGQTWTFHIRDGVKWVDYQGNEMADVTAEDWLWGLEWVLNFWKNDAANTSMALSIPQTIGYETTLSYLGLGLGVDTPSLGILLRNSRAFFLDFPYLLIFPAVIVSLITITFYLVGNAFSDAADPRNHV